MFTSKIRTRKKYDFCELNSGMFVGARWAGSYLWEVHYRGVRAARKDIVTQTITLYSCSNLQKHLNMHNTANHEKDGFYETTRRQVPLLSAKNRKLIMGTN